jgi:type IV fimbrial biogenesis protein FimT
MGNLNPTITRSAAPMHARANPGFTIIELLTTVSVVMILFTLAFPSLTNLILTQHVRAGASDLHTSLFYSRSEALKRAVNIEMVPVNNDWKNGWNIQLADGTVLRSRASLNARLASMPVDSGTKIIYRNDGRVTTAPAPIVVSASSNPQIAARCVVVDLSGRPSLVVDTDSNAANGCN